MNLLDLDALRTVRAYPCISVLVSTRPGDKLDPADRDRLDALVDKAARRLRRELPPSHCDALLGRLVRIADGAEAHAPRHALALFVNDDLESAAWLSVPVRDRVVIDHTFATRDLVEHDHRRQPYWVLVVSERGARLLFGDVDGLVEVDDDVFPFTAPPTTGERGAERTTPEEVLREVVRRVDAALGGNEAPLVLAGVERTVSAFARICGRPVLGRVTGGHDRTPPEALHAASRPAIERLLDARRSVALGQLERARSQRLLASGPAEVWSLANDGRVALVVAERGYQLAVRMGATPEHLEPADDPDAPGVVDDLIDEIVEVVLAHGGRAVFVDDDVLGDLGRVAAALRW